MNNTLQFIIAENAISKRHQAQFQNRNQEGDFEYLAGKEAMSTFDLDGCGSVGDAQNGVMMEAAVDCSNGRGGKGGCCDE